MTTGPRSISGLSPEVFFGRAAADINDSMEMPLRTFAAGNVLIGHREDLRQLRGVMDGAQM
eukprot:6489610-Pyramimonas_sp.AAC.1